MFHIVRGGTFIPDQSRKCFSELVVAVAVAVVVVAVVVLVVVLTLSFK